MPDPAGDGETFLIRHPPHLRRVDSSTSGSLQGLKDQARSVEVNVRFLSRSTLDSEDLGHLAAAREEFYVFRIGRYSDLHEPQRCWHFERLEENTQGLKGTPASSNRGVRSEGENHDQHHPRSLRNVYVTPSQASCLQACG